MSILDTVGRFFSIKKVSTFYYNTVEHDSLILSVKNDLFYWNSRNDKNGKRLSGTSADFLRLMGHYDEADGLDDVPEYSIDAFIRDTKQSGKFTFDYHGGYLGNCPYLISRGLTDQTVEKFRIEHCDERIIFPIFDNQQQRIGSINRLHGDEGTRYNKDVEHVPAIWPEEAFYPLNFRTHIFLFEGLFSPIRWWQFNLIKNAAYYSVLGNNYDRAVNIFSNFMNVYVICDSDATGYKTYQHLTTAHKNVIVVFPDKMPDDMSREEVKATLNSIRR